MLHIFLSLIFLYIFGNIETRMGLFEVTPANEKQLQDFVEVSGKLGLDLWKHPSVGQPVKFSTQSDSENVNYVINHLKEINLNLKILNQNLDDTIDKEIKDNEVQRMNSQFRAAGAGGIHTYFAPHKEYNDWMRSLSDQNQNLISLIDIGKSYEGRDMKVLKFTTGQKKEAIFLEAGVHAREWLGISTVIWILNKLISEYKSNNPEVKEIMNRFEVYVLPITNPDGYEVTRKGGKSRLWRKNTMPVENGCVGIDLNRNFDIDFGVSGVSRDPCNIVYPGSKPFNAPESRNFRDFVLSIKDKLKLFISFHAYSQLLLTPWAYTTKPPPDNKDIMRVANLMHDVIYKTSGKRYTVGSPAAILYAASGGCYDWVKTVGVKYSYTFEVRPGDDDHIGFMAPIEWINPTGEELYQAVLIAAKSI